MSGQFIDAPAPKFIDAPAPASTPPPSGGLDLGSIAKKVGGAVDAGWRNLGAARTAAARDPVGAAQNVLGGLEGGVAGFMGGPLTAHTSDVGKNVQAMGTGVVRGMFDPEQRAKYNAVDEDAILGPMGLRPKGNTPGEKLVRAGGDYGFQTAADPLTYAGAPIAKGIANLVGKGAGLVRDIPAVAKYVGEVKDAIHDPRLAPAISKVSHVIGKATAPLRGVVNAGKDVMFMNPAPHGVGNMGMNNFLANGPAAALKGFKYGVTGAPKGSVDALNAMGAGAWTPDLLGEPSPYGPVGWMNALGKKGVPAAVRGGVGAAAGGTIADKTDPSTDTPQQRAQRVAEGSILGGLTGASPEVLNASNKVMTRLEQGHRAAMLEGLPKVAEAAPKSKPHFTAAQVAALSKRSKVPDVHGPATINTNAFAISPQKTGRIKNWPGAGIPQEKPPDPRADLINGVFGGLPKSPVAKVATALGGPFAAWQADVVPRVVGGALKNAPARVEAVTRGQDVTNRDVLKDQPYKLQVGGPIGSAAGIAFNQQKALTNLIGPLGGVNPTALTNPDSFSLGDQAKGALYDSTPGRSVVGPFFGDTEFPQKAPAVPSATLDTLLGWYMKNKTPATDAILGIMQATGRNREQAAQLYERYKR
jgi:hypothetical protein